MSWINEKTVLFQSTLSKTAFKMFLIFITTLCLLKTAYSFQSSFKSNSSLLNMFSIQLCILSLTHSATDSYKNNTIL